MQDLIVQIQSMQVKPGDVIILTFSKDMEIDECNMSFKNIKDMCPNLNFIPNREDIIKNITVLSMQQIPTMRYDYSPNFDQEGLSI